MSLRKKLDKLVENRPKYTINSEIGANQSAARKAVGTRDTTTLNAEKQVSQNAANSQAAAINSSSSGAGVLAAMKGIAANSAAANTSIAGRESEVIASKRGNLMQANTAMAEEKDKAFDFNVNQPYQNKIQALRDRQKARRELLMKGIDSVTSISATSLSLGGMNNAGASAPKTEVDPLATKETKLSTPNPNLSTAKPPAKVAPIK